MSTSEYKLVKKHLQRACDDAKARCLGMDTILFTQQARLACAAIQAFGDHPEAVLFAEIVSPNVKVPRPDLIIMHPDIGVVVIENKGIRLEDIKAVEGSAIRVERNGIKTLEDPFQQAEKVMFRLKELMAKRVDIGNIAFNRMVALPQITEAAFNKKFSKNWEFSTIFADMLEDPKNLRIYISGFVQHSVPALFKNNYIHPAATEEGLAVLLGKSSLRPKRKRKTAVATTSIATTIDTIEHKPRERTLQQQQLVDADIEGVHRLYRGVAGSGKSLILAGQVARLLKKWYEQQTIQPARKRILVTCFNKTLKHYLKDKIDDEIGYLLDPQKLMRDCSIIHIDQVLSQLGRLEKLLAIPFTYGQNSDNEQRASDIVKAFDNLPDMIQNRLKYDAIFIDEAQDLEPSQFKLITRLVRANPDGGQTLGIFYDNAQNIYGRTLPVWEPLGINVVGGRTVYMDKCLRNTRQIVEFAFNVLIGTYAPEGKRIATRQFADLAGLRDRQLVSETDGRFNIHFVEREGLRVRVALRESQATEIKGVVDAIEILIQRENVQPSDILILYRSGNRYRQQLLIKLAMLAGKFHFTTKLVDSKNEKEKDHTLIQDNVLTVSTISSAKGYDAPIVFLMGVDDLENATTGRAKFYVGATRARHRLYVSGVKQSTPTLLDEAIQCVELSQMP